MGEDIRAQKTFYKSISINKNKYPLTLYSYYAIMFLSIPEGVSVATVIIDGVDVAPAGLVKRSSGTREPEGRPLGITTQCVLNG